jgi:hypothetical protein
MTVGGSGAGGGDMTTPGTRSPFRGPGHRGRAAPYHALRLSRHSHAAAMLGAGVTRRWFTSGSEVLQGSVRFPDQPEPGWAPAVAGLETDLARSRGGVVALVLFAVRIPWNHRCSQVFSKRISPRCQRRPTG